MALPATQSPLQLPNSAKAAWEICKWRCGYVPTKLVDSEFRISFNSHMSQNVILLIFFSNLQKHKKKKKKFFACRPHEKVVAQIKPVGCSVTAPGTDSSWRVYVEMHFILFIFKLCLGAYIRDALRVVKEVSTR